MSISNAAICSCDNFLATSPITLSSMQRLVLGSIWFSLCFVVAWTCVPSSPTGFHLPFSLLDRGSPSLFPELSRFAVSLLFTLRALFIFLMECRSRSMVCREFGQCKYLLSWLLTGNLYSTEEKVTWDHWMIIGYNLIVNQGRTCQASRA